MSSSSWDFEPKSIQARAKEITSNARVGLAILGALAGGTQVALAQEDFNPGNQGARSAQTIRNARAVYFDNVQDLLNKWTPDQNVYTKNPETFPGLGNAELTSLARWLAQEHPNWSVVFVGSARGESYANRDKGRAYEFALGQNLAGSSKFGSIIDSESKLKSGAILWIVNSTQKSERLKGWVESGLQKRYGVVGRGADGRPTNEGLRDGEERRPWEDNFEATLKESLGQRRWLDAAKDFITSVDASVSTARANEKARAEEARRTAERQAAEAKQAASDTIVTAQQNLKALQDECAQFRQDFPAIRGDLAYPNLQSFEDGIARAQSSFNSGDIADAKDVATKVVNGIDGRSRAMATYRKDGDDFEALAGTLKELNSHPMIKLGKSDLNSARASLSDAQVLWKQGRAEYSTTLDQARSGITLAQTEMEQALKDESEMSRLGSAILKLKSNPFIAAGEAKLRSANTYLTNSQELLTKGDKQYTLELLRARRDFELGSNAITDAQASDHAKKTATGVVISLASAFGIGALVVGNRRRVNPKAAAEERFKLLDAALGEKSGMLMDFDQFTEDFLKAANFTGKSDAIRDEVLQGVPKLYVLLTCAQSVLDRAEELIFPTSTRAKTRNTFSPKNYERALELLHDEKISWDKESDLSDVLRGKTLKSRALWSKLTDYEEFKESFEGIFNNFNAIAEDLGTKKQQLEDAQTASLEASAQAIQKVAVLKASSASTLVDESTRADTIVPTLANTLVELQKLQVADPISASEAFTELSADLDNTTAHIQMAKQLEESILKEIEADKAWLASNVFITAWIEDSIAKIRKESTNYLSGLIGAKGEIAPSTLEESLTTLATAAKLAKEQGTVLLGDYPKTLASAESEVAAARRVIVSSLGVTAEAAFSEEDRDPDVFIESGKDAASRAHASLDRGDVDSCFKELGEARECFNRASFYTKTTLESLEQHEARVAAIGTKVASLTARKQEFDEILGAIRARYDGEVEKLGAGDPTHPRSNDTIDDNIKEVETALASIANCLKLSEQARQQGKLIHSADLLKQADGLCELADFRYQEISEKRVRLDTVEQDNREAAGKLEQQASELHAEIERDKIISAATLKRFSDAQVEFTAAQAQIDKVGANPFTVQEALAKFERALDDVNNSISNDRENYHEAENSLGRARQELTEMTQTLQDIAQAGVNESRDLSAAEQEMEGWRVELTKLTSLTSEERGDWPELARQADRLVRKGAEILHKIENEEDEIHDAFAGIKSAESKISEARRWSGSYGVTLSGSPGKGAMEEALQLLKSGSYEEALIRAQAAHRLAANAITEAEAEESRREAAERRRQQEEEDRQRRARAAAEAERQRQSSYSSSSYSSGSSWSSSDSGSSSSSFGGGSDSGGSSSGW